MKVFSLVAVMSCAFLMFACSKPSDSTSLGPKKPSDPILNDFDKKIADSWVLTSRVTEGVTSPQAFVELQKKYPEDFAKFDPSVVSSAEVNISIYKYIAPTRCASDDKRLTFTSHYYSVCMNNDHLCDMSVLAMPASRDPCWVPDPTKGNNLN